MNVQRSLILRLMRTEPLMGLAMDLFLIWNMKPSAWRKAAFSSQVPRSPTREAYLVYLARFCFEHFGDSDACPMSYKKWRNS